MNYNVKTIPKFEKDLKKLVKKYPSLKSEYIELVKSLKTLPVQGTPLGNNCYKIRLSIMSKGKGKSGGARVITYCYVKVSTVFLLSIYDKSEKETISKEELQQILSEVH
jgi:mRNA-degrading endonuclease RelE of RelBE toxin-antitoxin system